MRTVLGVMLSAALWMGACPAGADEAPGPACLPPHSVALPAPSRIATPAVSGSQSATSANIANPSANAMPEVVAECRPQTVDTSVKVAQNSPKFATDFGSPAPPEGVGKKMKVCAYAYCINGRTASGTKTKLGTVAVDRRLIPLGSKIYIPGYGWGTAQDTGGHMRGNVIDIWYPSYGKCMQWGARNVTITVLPK